MCRPIQYVVRESIPALIFATGAVMSIEHDDSEGALVPFGDRGKDDGAPNEAVDFGPAPGIKRRQLIFDSLRKITDSADPASRRSIDSSGGTYVYTWGAGYHGQLGRKFTRGQKKYASVPQYVAFPEPVAIRQVACGGLHTAAVSDDGKVYTWGDGRMGQLGQVHEGFVNQPTPRAVKTLSAFVVAVACGQSHTVVLTDKGRLYSWGFSRYGQTGHGDRQMVKIPKLVDTEKNVEFTHIACGDKHSVALSRTGRVFSFGCGEHGQLGHGDQADQLRPTVIQSLAATRITSLRCGAIFTCMIADAGELHICGFGEYFYPNTDHNFMYLPRKFAFSSRISSVSCGQSHIVALSAKGEVYCVGAGEYGQLGHGVRGNLSVPRLIIASKDIVQVAAGRYHSLALTNFGAIYSWGNNDNGQLGQDTDDNLLFPRVIDHILGSVVGQIECGEHHSVALTSIKWAALGNDMHEWFLGQKQEHLLKLRYLKKSNYGLGKKELGKIREEMSTWMKSRQKTRELTKDDEAKDTKAQLESIRSRDAMSHEVNEQIESERRASKSAKPAAVAALPVKERTVSLDPSDMQVSPQTPAPPPGKHSVSDQVRARQKRMKQLSKQLNALLSARTESKLQAANAEANAVVLPAIPHTDRPGMEVAELPPPPPARTVFLRESAQMVTRMTSALTERHEADPEAHMRSTFAIVCSLRKEYDTLRAKTVERQAVLHRLQREVQYITTTAKAMEAAQSKYEEKLKGLEMQLDTVTIKINETEENRKNYELNIAHLKEEELDRFFQMEALRKQRAEINALYRKMNTLKNQAQMEQEQAGQEFDQFQNEILSFHQFAVEQLQSFQNVFDVLKAQRKKRQSQKSEREHKTVDKFNGRIERMLEKIREREAQANELQKALEALNAQMQAHNVRFQRITSATGLENPDDIVNKFYLKEEIKLDLEKEIQEKAKHLESLQQKKAGLQAKLEEERNNFMDSRWRDVDQLQEKYRETCARADKSREQADKAMQRLALLQEGISGLLHIVIRVQGIEMDQSWLESGSTWSPEKFDQVLAAFQEAVTLLKSSVDASGKGDITVVQGLKGIPYIPADTGGDDAAAETATAGTGDKGGRHEPAAAEGVAESNAASAKKRKQPAQKSNKLGKPAAPNKQYAKT